ncbi:MAG: rRNA maturation RNase YbeY [Bifidobacteriaceae bacterium]|nr:rRNA maturation RNase YbeY [Bifidobacteriaceae bacterium]
MSVDVLNEAGAEVDEAEFAALGRYVMDAMNVHPQAELVISFVDATVMADLHVRFLDEEGPTDVMSFPMDELRPGTADEPSAEGILGDVVVCPEVAAKQAKELGHSAVEEMLLLTVHGILHLLGFDHAEPEEREAMFGLQRKLLLTFLASR